MLVERKNVKLNGTDFSSYFADVGYEVKYVRVQGNNGGMMQNGDTMLDTIKRKAVVTLPIYPLTETQQKTILDELWDDYCTLYYYDPYTKAYKTISAITDEPTLKYRGRGADGNSYWTRAAVVLTEQ